MLDRADLRTLRNLLVHEGPAVPRRVFGAWKLGAQRQLVADARVVGDRLMVVSCAMERVEIESGATNRAGVARREGYTRARVTQVMGLLDLPEHLLGRLLTGDEAVAGMSIREALRATGP